MSRTNMSISKVSQNSGVVSISPSDRARNGIFDIRKTLKSRFLGMEEEINSATIALLVERTVALIGAPGIAKTAIAMMIAELTQMVTYYVQLHPFSTVDDVIGATDIKAYGEGKFQRIIQGTAATADLVIIDEFLKNPIVLQALLTMISQRLVNNGNQTIPVPMRVFFGMSNEYPEDPKADPLWDRMDFKHEVVGIDNANDFMRFVKMVDQMPREDVLPRLKAKKTPPKPILSLNDIDAAQNEIFNVCFSKESAKTYGKLWVMLKKADIRISPRKAESLIPILKANAWLDKRQEIEDEDLAILENCIWSIPDQREKVKEVMHELVSSFDNEIKTITKGLPNLLNETLQKMLAKPDQRFAILQDSDKEFRAIQTKLEDIQSKLQEKGKSTTRVDEALDQLIDVKEQCLAGLRTSK